MIQKYISVIKLKKQTVIGAMGLLQTTTVYLYANMGAMVQSQKSLCTKRDDQTPVCREKRGREFIYVFGLELR